MKKKNKNSKGYYKQENIIYDNPKEAQSYPHFRRYYKSKHPAMITGEHSESEWNYRKTMHGERDGRHLNEIISPNPNPLDPNPMYVAKRVRHDNKDNFSKWRYNWKIRNKKK